MKVLTFSSASWISCAALGSARCPFELKWFGVCTLDEPMAHGAGLGMGRKGPWTQIEEGTWRQLPS